MLQQTGHWSLQCILVLIEAVCHICSGCCSRLCTSAAGWLCSVGVHSVLAVSSYNTVAVLLLLHVLWKNIKSQSAPSSSSCSLQLLLSWSSWPWWPSVTLQSLNAWMEKSSTKLHLQVYPTFKWNTQCYYSVCLFTHSNLRSSKFTRLLLDSDVVCDVACCQIFIFNVCSR